MTNSTGKRNIFQVVLLVLVTVLIFQQYPVHGKSVKKHGKQPSSTLDEDIFKSDSFFKKNDSNDTEVTTATPLPQVSPDSIQNFTGLLSRVGEISADDSNNQAPAPADRTSLSFQDLENSSGGLLDQLTGLIGWSSMQIAIYPIIMCLLAGFTGIFWTWVFVYLYTYFFTGKGYFGGGSSGLKGRAQSSFSGFDTNWILTSLPEYALTAIQKWDDIQSTLN